MVFSPPTWECCLSTYTCAIVPRVGLGVFQTHFQVAWIYINVMALELPILENLGLHFLSHCYQHFVTGGSKPDK